jgi:YjbE family integral membrane protein
MDQISLTQDLAALLQVVLIDITLAGDNAIVVGMAVAGLPDRQKRRAITLGILGATVIRIGLGYFAMTLLRIIGALLAGGLLLLWVCWKMFRDLRSHRWRKAAETEQRKTLRQAMTQIILADVSMSLDNVLAVAGVARDAFWVLAVGLLLSVVLMGVAANLLARVLERQRWVAWVGLVVVLYVAGAMIWHGGFEVADAISP